MQSITYKGIEIATEKEIDGTWSVGFNNAAGSFEELNNIVSRPQGLQSLEDAIDAGKRFVDEHQWELIKKQNIFKIYVRLDWNGKWTYGIRGGGITCRGFVSREEAIIAAEKEAVEEIKRIEESIKATICVKK